jgi:hypothetical protein
MSSAFVTPIKAGFYGYKKSESQAVLYTKPIHQTQLKLDLNQKSNGSLSRGLALNTPKTSNDHLQMSQPDYLQTL